MYPGYNRGQVIYNAIRRSKNMCRGINYKLIQDFLASNGLSKSAFCKNCGISMQTLNNILSNKVEHLRYTTLRKVWLYTQVDINSLMNLTK